MRRSTAQFSHKTTIVTKHTNLSLKTHVLRDEKERMQRFSWVWDVSHVCVCEIRVWCSTQCHWGVGGDGSDGGEGVWGDRGDCGDGGEEGVPSHGSPYEPRVSSETPPRSDHVGPPA